ncbi:hypothetical protein PIROE2DRAFT_69844 [Piromyces sp. E2]|nr:hypothetical protein PIROE2DRAFT_69844 [Piromyces sp. E2]|eukprot:OUM59513.1 hypothetical protein PIROE2DRAFT_69844 [Piromyces sp. E2]
MPKDEKIYPTEEIQAPEAAYTTREYTETDAMLSPYADQQSSGSYQPPANPDKSAYTYTNPFTNSTTEFSSTPVANTSNTSTYTPTAQYTNSQSYPVNNTTTTTSGGGGCLPSGENRDTTSSLCTLCCGLTLCTTMLTCCLGCCRCCLCGCGDVDDIS